MSLRKVFGIISYFPDNDSAYHIETRKERSRRFRELLFKLEELWDDIDIIVIAQNWLDFEVPKIKNTVIIYQYDKLGILGARRELRKKFLESAYDYLIMADDDAMPASDNPQAYLDEIDKHPNGVGTLRKNKSPLQFFAISKAVYSQIDMPDIDAEKGEGFEDDVFVASCFSKFPDVAFMFSPDYIQETSFRYTGEGACPSTWSRERKYNWDYMRDNTNSLVYDLEHPAPEEFQYDGTPSIDLIVTYVNSSDRNWINDFVKATKTHNPNPERFRSWGTLRYMFRGIEKYMPFVRRIILIVSRESQVPYWINTENVRVVYHQDFIPKNLLPTFNSCTIESYLWNITDLSDKIIYFNDDMFPIGYMSEETFFTGDVPNIKFTEPEKYSTRAIFQSQCRSGMDLVTKVLNLPLFEQGKMFRPYHISAAITRDSMIKVGELCKDLLPKLCTRTRVPSNVNQYIYAYYQYFNNNYIDKTVSYNYFELVPENMANISNTILHGNSQMICINDSSKIKDASKIRYSLDTCFTQKFPNKSKYEI